MSKHFPSRDMRQKHFYYSYPQKQIASVMARLNLEPIDFEHKFDAEMSDSGKPILVGREHGSKHLFDPDKPDQCIRKVSGCESRAARRLRRREAKNAPRDEVPGQGSTRPASDR